MDTLPSAATAWAWRGAVGTAAFTHRFVSAKMPSAILASEAQATRGPLRAWQDKVGPRRSRGLWRDRFIQDDHNTMRTARHVRWNIHDELVICRHDSCRLQCLHGSSSAPNCTSNRGQGEPWSRGCAFPTGRRTATIPAPMSTPGHSSCGPSRTRRERPRTR
jgi:hypothetical protein